MVNRLLISGNLLLQARIQRQYFTAAHDVRLLSIMWWNPRTWKPPNGLGTLSTENPFIQVEQPWRQVVVFWWLIQSVYATFHFGHNQLNLVLTGRGINWCYSLFESDSVSFILFYLSYRLYATLPQKCMSQETLEDLDKLGNAQSECCDG